MSTNSIEGKNDSKKFVLKRIDFAALLEELEENDLPAPRANPTRKFVHSKFQTGPPRKRAVQKENTPRKSTVTGVMKARKVEVKKELPIKSKLTIADKKPLKTSTDTNLKMDHTTVIAKNSIELSFSDHDFLQFEDLKEQMTPKQKILELLDEDREAAHKLQETVKDFILLQEKRHQQITELLNDQKGALYKPSPSLNAWVRSRIVKF